MILETVISIAGYIGDKLAEKFIQDGFAKWTDKYKNPLKEQLTDIIYKTQDEFLKKYPEQKKYKEGQVPFWASQIIVYELLKYRYYDKPDFSKIREKLSANKNILIPTKDQLDEFILMFIMRTEADEKLKEIEIEIGYKKRIFAVEKKVDQNLKELSNISDKIDSLNSEITETLEGLNHDICNFASIDGNNNILIQGGIDIKNAKISIPISDKKALNELVKKYISQYKSVNNTEEKERLGNILKSIAEIYPQLENCFNSVKTNFKQIRRDIKRTEIKFTKSIFLILRTYKISVFNLIISVLILFGISIVTYLILNKQTIIIDKESYLDNECTNGKNGDSCNSYLLDIMKLSKNHSLKKYKELFSDYCIGENCEVCQELNDSIMSLEFIVCKDTFELRNFLLKYNKDSSEIIARAWVKFASLKYKKAEIYNSWLSYNSFISEFSTQNKIINRIDTIQKLMDKARENLAKDAVKIKGKWNNKDISWEFKTKSEAVKYSLGSPYVYSYFIKGSTIIAVDKNKDSTFYIYSFTNKKLKLNEIYYERIY